MTEIGGYSIRRLRGAFTLVVSCSIACGPSGPSDEDGAPPSCGDSIVDSGELCDDGNRLSGDGCNSECVPSGMPFDCIDLRVGETPDLWLSVKDLLPMPDGTFLVAGWFDSESGTRAWLARYTVTGEPLWSVEPTVADPETQQIRGLADAGPTGAWALGVNAFVRGRLLRYDINGNLEATTALESEAGQDVTVYAIESTPEGVWLAGSLGEDAWVGIYDPVGDTVRDLLLEDHLGYRDQVYAIARSQDEVAVATTMSTSPNNDEDVMLLASTDILVVHFDLQGNELRRTFVGPSPDPEYVRGATEIVADGVGNWFVGGNTTPHDVTAFSTGWLVPVQAPPPWSWATDKAQLDTVGVLLAADEGVLIAGNRTAADTSGVLVGQGWISSLAADATTRWTFDRLDGDIDDYRHYAHEVLTRDFEGRVRTAGVYHEPGDVPVLRSCLVAE